MPKTGAGLVQVLVCIPPGVLPAGSHVNGDQALNPTSTAQKPTTQQFYRRNNVDKTLHELANHHVVFQQVFVRDRKTLNRHGTIDSHHHHVLLHFVIDETLQYISSFRLLLDFPHTASHN